MARLRDALAENGQLQADLAAGGAEWTRMAEQYNTLIGERDAAEAKLAAVRKLLPHWRDEAQNGHGANRAGLYKAIEQLEAALDAEAVTE